MDPRFQRAPFLDVGVHVIRIKADASVPDMRGQVVPEGMHQDGFGEFLFYFEFLFISIWAIGLMTSNNLFTLAFSPANDQNLLPVNTLENVCYCLSLMLRDILSFTTIVC